MWRRTLLARPVCRGWSRRMCGLPASPIAGSCRAVRTSSWKAMFTGLIECTGQVLEVKPVEAGFQIRVRAAIGPDLLEGESVAVNGVCLTAVETKSGELRASIGPETARVTTLGLLKPGSLVNLERAIRADGRMGGHFVLGHVDG